MVFDLIGMSSGSLGERRTVRNVIKGFNDKELLAEHKAQQKRIGEWKWQLK